MSPQGGLGNKRIAFLATDGVEQIELVEPKKALEKAGASVDVIAPKSGSIRAWDHTDWGDSIHVDRQLDQAEPSDYDALVVPGGVASPDRLRMNPKAVEFVSEFASSGKPIASICHGPWLLVEAGEAAGRRMTSWPSLRTDIRNAGGEWVDEPVVTDGNLTTSRKPDDIPAFNERLLREFAADRPGRQLRAAS